MNRWLVAIGAGLLAGFLSLFHFQPARDYAIAIPILGGIPAIAVGMIAFGLQEEK